MSYLKRIISELIGRNIQLSSNILLRYAVVGAGVIVIFFVGFILWLAGRSEQSIDQECAFRITEQDTPPPVTTGDAVRLNTCVVLEVAASNTSRTLGLSHRSSLPWDRGMLFDFERPAEYCMWMKDMRFSLDVVWLNEEHEIVGMRENVSPQTYPDSFCGPKTARYVIEVNAGVVEAGDLRVGQRLRL